MPRLVIGDLELQLGIMLVRGVINLCVAEKKKADLKKYLEQIGINSTELRADLLLYGNITERHRRLSSLFYDVGRSLSRTAASTCEGSSWKLRFPW